MKNLEPITREETMLAKEAGRNVQELEPVTREEFFLAKAAGQDVPELEPVTRKECFLADVIEAIEGGGGGGSDLGTKTISANGTYNASDDSLDGYSKVTVNVPAPTGTKSISITENGTTTEDVTQYADAEITVNVSGGGGGRLPDGFQEVEYLGMSQYCYFALGAKTYENIGFKTIFLLAERYTGYGPHFVSTTNNYIKFLPRNNGGTMIQFKGGSEKSSSTVIPLNNVATAEFNTDGNGVLNASWSGGSLSVTPTAGTNTIGNLYLCAYANSPGNGDWSMNGLLYEFKLYNNGELVENFVPCYRVSDGVIGLYDIILGNFYTNQGTGNITKGRDITDASAQALSILLGESE